jgi:ferredoxin
MFPLMAGNADEQPFEVVCVRSGVTLTVPPERSILSVVREHGIQAFSSCSEGICGTCETEVVDGVPDHRDLLLTAAEREASRTMLICVSRCRRGPLVLDL